MKGSRTNLPSVDKCLDMMKAHRVMAVLADRRYRFCYCYPVIAHSGVSLSLGKVHNSYGMRGG